MIIIPQNADVMRTTDYIRGEWNHPGQLQTFDILKNKSIKHVVDIGANVGIFTDLCFQHFSPIRVDCIEPHPDNIATLKLNFDSRKEVVLHQCAVYYGITESTSRNPIDEPVNTGGYILSSVPPEHLGRFADKLYEHPNLIFSVSTLEAQLAEIPDVIKMDIEGSEYNVIENSTILKEARFLIIEFHNHTEDYLRIFLQKHLPMFTIRIISNESYGGDGQFYYTLLEKTC